MASEIFSSTFEKFSQYDPEAANDLTVLRQHFSKHGMIFRITHVSGEASVGGQPHLIIDFADKSSLPLKNLRLDRKHLEAIASISNLKDSDVDRIIDQFTVDDNAIIFRDELTSIDDELPM